MRPRLPHFTGHYILQSALGLRLSPVQIGFERRNGERRLCTSSGNILMLLRLAHSVQLNPSPSHTFSSPIQVTGLNLLSGLPGHSLRLCVCHPFYIS
jgi:hypothetical protein